MAFDLYRIFQKYWWYLSVFIHQTLCSLHTPPCQTVHGRSASMQSCLWWDVLLFGLWSPCSSIENSGPDRPLWQEDVGLVKKQRPLPAPLPSLPSPSEESTPCTSLDNPVSLKSNWNVKYVTLCINLLYAHIAHFVLSMLQLLHNYASSISPKIVQR